ncbi:YopX family protein [Streptococcus suis]|uniref:YopX family protein n=1 Tax=Streptococcus suis TaxID=1307 RepID=UPI0037563FBB
MIQRCRAFYEGKMYGVKAVIWTSRGLYVTLDEGNKAGRRVRGAVLMQSTGLVDVNGKEIFEGDVVLQNGWKKVAVSFGTQEVEENFGDKRIFQGFNLYLGGGYPEAVMSKYEIIGNIYENPELVEGSS